MSYRLGVDVGGTFTDLLLFNDDTKQITLEKVPTTVGNQAIGITNGVKKITEKVGIKPSDIALFMHGTTAATNAVLEHKGSKTALIVTEGFRDILQIMRQDRPRLYDWFAKRPIPLVPRCLRYEISERILHTGEVFKPLDQVQLSAVIDQIAKEDVKAIAVCLLHSYVNPAHELRIKEILREKLPNIFVSISSEILPEIKEYERMSTTVINSYVLPIVDRYFTELTSLLKGCGFNKTVHVMQSNGGIMPSALTGKKSVNTILSGPAAGVLGGVALATQAGIDNAITVDMGGTSFDICLAHQGKPKTSRGSNIGGHALRVPMIDIHSIGAGGGSIAWIDSGNIVKVGPQSAGAEPGPACYMRGGKLPTVTDANLVLGRLNLDFFLGGEMQVDPNLAHKAIETHIAKPLGMSVLESAEGIIKVVNAMMVKGIRFVSVEKGYDPREFSLVCFGGNGPVHAAELAEELSIPKLMIPFGPGVNCAYGLLIADFRYDYVKTYIRHTNEINLDEINELCNELDELARARMKEENVPDSGILIHHSLDMRYAGQGHELEVNIGSGKIAGATLAKAVAEFNSLHEKHYGFYKNGEPTEIINFRVLCFGIIPKPQIKREKLNDADSGTALKGQRDVFFRGRYHKTNIYDRSKLQSGNTLRGPAIIEQKDSTTVLFPGNTAKVDEFRNIIVNIK